MKKIEKLTEDMVKEYIKSVNYFKVPGSTMITCYITTKAGYVVTGESACINKEMYREELGKQIAYKDAFSKLWANVAFHTMEINHLMDFADSKFDKMEETIKSAFNAVLGTQGTADIFADISKKLEEIVSNPKPDSKKGEHKAPVFTCGVAWTKEDDGRSGFLVTDDRDGSECFVPMTQEDIRELLQGIKECYEG